MGRKPTKTPNDELDKFLLRMPNGLRDRIKSASERNNRSMNAEIIDTLERAYPPASIDVRVLTDFLASLEGLEPTSEEKEYLANINRVLASMPHPYTVKAGWDGVISFFPYATSDASGSDENKKDPEP